MTIFSHEGVHYFPRETETTPLCPQKSYKKKKKSRYKYCRQTNILKKLYYYFILLYRTTTSEVAKLF